MLSRIFWKRTQLWAWHRFGWNSRPEVKLWQTWMFKGSYLLKAMQFKKAVDLLLCEEGFLLWSFCGIEFYRGGVSKQTNCIYLWKDLLPPVVLVGQLYDLRLSMSTKIIRPFFLFHREWNQIFFENRRPSYSTRPQSD